MNERKSTSNQPRRKPLFGFSLIELMTVIAIMAILTGVAFPGVKAAMMNAQMAAATQNARSIGIGLRNYASDYDGAYPAVDEEGNDFTSSNAAFRELIPDYIDSEKIFPIKRSAWGKMSDGRIDDPEDRLQPGENHFAYISGLHNTSRSDWPLVVDGTNGSGTYTRNEGEKGGCWAGKKAIVVTVGGSAVAVRLKGDNNERYLPRYGYPEENALDVASYMGETALLLDPE